MIQIRPSADLRNNYNEISRICHETNEPMYITRNGYNDLVVMSNEAYEKYEEEMIDRLIEKNFNKKYPDFETLKKDLEKYIEQGLQDIK